IELISSAEPLKTENDALDLAALCSEHDTYMLMIHSAALSRVFFNIKTRAAGNMIQKLINYGVRTAVIIPEEINRGRFKEMSMEMNKGRHFRLYEDREEAEKWLLQ
ncbi:MAG: DUF4180 domain-containing protein, partial [Halanaerobiaceae bacterium]|nr:DUF4180 domain-containing protein [Halanaerobiaceae bacterium]